jgi:transcriptional regulator with XRE-family HTH domain
MLHKTESQANKMGEPHKSQPPVDTKADEPTPLNARIIIGGMMKKGRDADEPTPLALFVRQRLEELDMKQSDFCRLTGFDQGLLSKIQNSVINSVSLESALRLAIGLSVSPRVILSLTDRLDMQDLVMRAYAIDFFPQLADMNGLKIPGPVVEITQMALYAYTLGRSLAPAYTILSHLSVARRGSKERLSRGEAMAEANKV